MRQVPKPFPYGRRYCDETRRLNIARRFGSAMISNTDSTFLIYSTEHMLIKVYKGRGVQATVSAGVRDAPSDAFLAGAIRSAARSGRFSVEAGTRAAPFPEPRSPLAALYLRCAPGQVSLDEAEQSPGRRSITRTAPSRRESAASRTTAGLSRRPPKRCRKPEYPRLASALPVIRSPRIQDPSTRRGEKSRTQAVQIHHLQTGFLSDAAAAGFHPYKVCRRDTRCPAA